MKTEAIQKINKIGKISNIVALICKILIIIGLVFCIIGTIICFVFPKSAIKATPIQSTTIEIDYGAFGITIPEDRKELLEEMEFSEGEWRIETVKSGVISGRLEIEAAGQSQVPSNISVTDNVVKMDMVTEGKIFTARDAGVMLLAGMIVLVMTLITLNFIGALCKAFRDCESPFEERIIKKMQRLAIVLIPWTVVSSVSDSFMSWLVSGKTGWSLSVDMGIVLVVLIVLVLVYIFKYGAVLQQESDETL